MGLHALLGLCFAWWGDGPVGAPRSVLADDSALVTYLPPPEPPEPQPEPKKAAEPPLEATPPPPPPSEPPPLRLGVDESTANTPAWLGFKEATEHNAPKADIDQSALEFEPGRPGPPGLPGPATPAVEPSPAPQPVQPTPPAPPPEPKPVPAEAARTPQPSVPPAPAQPGTEASDIADRAKPPEAQERPTPNPPPEPANESRPPAESPEAAAPAPVPEQPEGQPTPDGDPLTPGTDLPAGERVDREVGEVRPAEQAVTAALEALSHEVEVGPLPEGVDRPVDPEQFERPPNPPPDVPEVIGPPVPESLLPVDPEASQPSESHQAVAPESEVQPATESAPAASPAQAGGGGNDGRPGEQADRESDPSSMKPIRLDRWKLGRVLAGEGVNVRTTRPRWSTTTLLTATAPKNPVVRVTFGRNGKVIEAAFVNGQGSGYDNVDEPLLNALHSWTASGKRIRDLPASDPKAGLTIVFIITLR
ncbi:MAG: hypothetical protein IT436_03740 [Phycisphaerales bacterium]|nr:hypothetical protein [Phycisphaerales bacterium]